MPPKAAPSWDNTSPTWDGTHDLDAWKTAPFKASPEGSAATVGPRGSQPAAPIEVLTGDQNIKTPEEQGVSNSDRVHLQNFAADPVAAKAYLEQQHPDMEVALHHSDPIPAETLPMGGAGSARQEVVPQVAKSGGTRVLVRPKGSQDPWKVIDPQTGIPTSMAEIPEALKDLVMDNAYGLPAALLQGGASALGGVGGAAVGGAAGALGGPEAIPAGAFAGAKFGSGLAGGGAAAGLEYLRQKLGSMFGIPQGVDTTKIKDEALGGLIAPMVVGTGAGKPLAKAAGVTYDSQRGLLSAAVNKATPAVTSFFSGMPSKEIAQARELLPQMREVEKKGISGVMDVVKDAQDQTREALFSNQQKVGADIMNVLADSGKKVDVTGARGQLEGLIRELEAGKGTRDFTANSQAKLDYVKNEYDKMFLPKPPPEVLQHMRQLDNQLAKVKPEIEAGYKALQAGTPSVDEMNSFYNMRDKLTQAQKELEALKLHWATPPDEVHPLRAQVLKDEISDLSKARASGDKYAGKSNFDNSITSRASKARGLLNDSIEQAVKDVDNSYGTKGIGPLWQRYAQLKDTQAALQPFLEGDAGEKGSFSILRNLGSPANTPTRNRLQKMDKEFGTNVVNNADLLNSLKIFSDPANTSLSGWGSTSTSKTGFARSAGAVGGGGLGLLLSKISGGTIPAGWATGAGIGIGAATGQKLVTPAAIRRYLNLGATIRNTSGFLNTVPGLGLQWSNPAAADGITNSWEALHGR